MKRISSRKRLWLRRRKKTAKQIGADERPRLTVYRSSRHMYAQIIDPLSGRTLMGVSTRTPVLAGQVQDLKGVDAAKTVGEAIARAALERDIREVTFNRNGFVYTGRVKALADAAREAGLSF